MNNSIFIYIKSLPLINACFSLYPLPTNYWQLLDKRRNTQGQINYSKHKSIIQLLPHQHQLWPILPYKYQLYASSDQQAFPGDLILQTFSSLFENVLSTLTSILVSSKAGMFDVKNTEQTIKIWKKIKNT